MVLDVEEPEWMSTGDVDIPPLDSCEFIEEDRVLPVVTLDEIFSLPWDSFSDNLERKEK